ncbi:MAG: ABC transporter ATP-binding protein [Acidobacteriota bacterium]|nr:ABC transporter ATP-binding protein [Acidobacteriota bacterium]
MSVAVTARGLCKTFRDGARTIEVLRGVDLDVAAGEFVAVVGPSGCGKSTLLHLVGGLDRPDAGSLEIGGEALAGLEGGALARFRNRTLGFVFQFQELLADFTALENVILPGRIRGLGTAELEARGRELLAEVALEDRADAFPGSLSGGERQRVALCRALLLEPPLLLADEPTGSLDPASGEAVFDLMLRLQARHGTTAMVVTHNPSLARRCGRVLELAAGRLSPFQEARREDHSEEAEGARGESGRDDRHV